MSDSSFLPIGTMLSCQYKILRQIGAGGFGKTYLVEDQLGVKKVVKELFISSMCTRDAATRSVTVSVGENREIFQQQLEKFREEARRIFSLSHPNIVKVSALFNENNTAYYVMDYIEGESLAQKSRRTPLTEPQIMRYLNQLLSAFEYIHSHGVTHLDLKPENIMIDRNDNVVLIDFGASKLFNIQSVNKTMMTSMRPPFTPGYAPIEQENGNVKDMGPHCDIYALGATLYTLYVGARPASPFEIFQNELPEIPNASPQMQEVIKKAMAFMVKDRINDIAEFRSEIGQLGNAPMTRIDNDKTVVPELVDEKTKVQQYELKQKLACLPQNSKASIETKIISLETKIVGQETRLDSINDKGQIILGLLDAIKDKKLNDKGQIILGLLDAIKNKKLNVETTHSSNNSEVETVTPQKRKIPKNLKSFTETVNGVSFKMIAVEGGTFKMGAQSKDPNKPNYDKNACDYESPVHDVTLDSFYMAQFVVTEDLWDAVMNKNKSKESIGGLIKRLFGITEKPREGYPKTEISWNDCQEFIKKLNQLTGKNFRLPTEAEWEYAARGGRKSHGYKYSGSNTLKKVAWHEGNSTKSSHRVGTKSPNELGIYDMSGNVYEWCADWFDENFYDISYQTNPTGPSLGSRHVRRGGSWSGYAQSCRVAYRGNSSPGYRGNSFVGFRLALRP